MVIIEFLPRVHPTDKNEKMRLSDFDPRVHNNVYKEIVLTFPDAVVRF